MKWSFKSNLGSTFNFVLIQSRRLSHSLEFHLSLIFETSLTQITLILRQDRNLDRNKNYLLLLLPMYSLI
ncbi:hypothetical protein FGO68_gene16229 [Halteria grandinella]|uniref:Uncharacterized protein n=1 Tax=Halteria grandinella TaxID=5974 RepID=A0A8J8NH31_HALGN|nr:hypothetical protein FGO68_gene16229 [Halteria grandinella]